MELHFNVVRVGDMGMGDPRRQLSESPPLHQQ
jgi:hypothetical protein